MSPSTPEARTNLGTEKKAVSFDPAVQIRTIPRIGTKSCSSQDTRTLSPLFADYPSASASERELWGTDTHFPAPVPTGTWNGPVTIMVRPPSPITYPIIRYY